MTPKKSHGPKDARQLIINFVDPVAPVDDGNGEAAPEVQPAPTPAPDRRLFYMSFGSGSSGNASYLGTDSGGIIIDAGVKADVIENALRTNGIPMSKVKGILLTHDHSDHVRYAYTLLRNNKHMRLFCTPRVLNGLLRRHSISKRIKEYHIQIWKETPFTIGQLAITAFDVPHDGSDNMGFSITCGDRNFVIATDLGEAAGRARYYIERANYLVIEANYDARMLRTGPYPEYLKARIATSHGHMDNADTARLLAEIINPDLRYIFLCHLSHDNNTPEKAMETITTALKEKGVTIGDCSMSLADRSADVSLMPLPRFDATRLFVFR